MSIAKIELRTPIWGGKGGRQLGIAEYRMTGDMLEVTCSYRNNAGELILPSKYMIGKVKAITYPMQFVHGTKLYVIPVSDFVEVKACK